MTAILLNADAGKIPLEDNSVHCVVTSPPYLCLRDYQVDGQVGHETPEEYTQRIADIFDEVRRVLREDGTLFLVIGDSYNGSGGAGGDYNSGGLREGQPRYGRKSYKGLKQKDLIGVPWMVAFELRRRGWYLRQDIIWFKPNAMPGPYTDRACSSHEYIFLLSKSQRYYFDYFAIQEVAADGVGRRNPRSVWLINTQSLEYDHYASFPTTLVDRCLAAGISAGGVCSVCGKPLVRIVERNKRSADEDAINRMSQKGVFNRHTAGLYGIRGGTIVPYIDRGFDFDCSCQNRDISRPVVLDPFCGSGTTLLVAEARGAIGIGCDISYHYLRDVAAVRLASDEYIPYDGVWPSYSVKNPGKTVKKGSQERLI